MTIRTKEPEVPDEFSPARLFLDDIEEIVRILVDATKTRKQQLRPFNEDDKPRVTLTIRDQVCDEVQELPKIAKKTTDLSVRVERQKWTEASLTFSRDDSHLRCFAFTNEEKLSLFHKLAPVFKRRNLYFRTLVHSYPAFFVGLVLASIATPIAALILMFRKHTPPTQTIVIGLLSAAIFTSVLAAFLHHTTIILRASSEPSALRQELLHKFPLVAISSALTFLFTMLGLYLKHKFWP